MLESYPDIPGYKGRDTSALAAEAIAPSAKSIRNALWSFMKTRPDALYSPDYLSSLLKYPKHSVRSRFSELAAKGLIEDSGQRTKNQSGRPAILWRVK